MLIEIDDNFNLMNESIFQDRYVGKNIASLRQSIDSMTVRMDSVKKVESKALFSQSYHKTLARVEPAYETKNAVNVEKDSLTAKKPVINFDSLYHAQTPDVKM